MPHNAWELAEEHRLISDLTHALTARASGRGNVRSVAALESLVDALTACLVDLHIVKEERALFPLLQARGLPRDHAVVSALLSQHDSARVYLRRLREACSLARSGGRQATASLATLAREFGELIREHVRIEDEYFYALARRQLQPGDLDTLAGAFAAMDRAIGGAAIREEARRALGRPTKPPD
jgi:hemerythrin-like domain-containing protein